MHHRRRAGQRRVLRAACWGCASSRRPSTRTTRPSTTSSTPTSSGSAGADITFFEYPGVAPRTRRRRDGAPRLLPRRLRASRSTSGQERAGGTIEARRRSCFEDPEGLRLELLVDESGEPPLTAEAPDIPPEHRAARLRRRARIRFAARARSERLLEALGLRARVGGARRPAQQLLRLRRAARGAWAAGGGHRPPRRLRVAAGRARGVAAAGDRGRRPADARDRPLLLQVDLLPRAERRAVRDRDDRAGIHRRRATRDARRVALAAAELRAVPRRRSKRS